MDNPVPRGTQQESKRRVACRVDHADHFDGPDLNLRLFGTLGLGDRRYAVRELVYLDLMPPGAPYRYMTGSELVDLMAEADRYMAGHGMHEEQAIDVADVIESGAAATAPPAGNE